MPLVSVVMACFNGGPGIRRAIDSVLMQTCADLELIVVDDCSTDGSPELLAEIAKSDPRIRLIFSERNSGPGAARNKGISAAQGRWIAIIDCDDWYEPQRLEILLNEAEKDGAKLIVDNQFFVREDAERPWRQLRPGSTDLVRRLTPNDLLKGDRLGQISNFGLLKPVVERRFLDDSKINYDEEFGIGEDFYFLLKCAQGASYALFVTKPLYNYQFRQGSYSNSPSLDKVVATRILHERCRKLFEGRVDSTLLELMNERAKDIDSAIQYKSLMTRIKARDFGRSFRQISADPGVLETVAQRLIFQLAGRLPSLRDGLKGYWHSGLATLIFSKVYPGSTVVDGHDVLRQGQSFFLVPGKHGPRWIVPGNARYGRVFLEQWRPYDVSSQLKWRVLLAAYRLGFLARFPGIQEVSIAGAEQAWDRLGWDLPDPPVPIIYVGTAGPTRKAVVGLVDPRTHELKSIAKIPLNPGSVATIKQEMRVLTKLALLKPGLAPPLVYTNSETGIAVQEAVAGEPTGRRLTSSHVEWLSDLGFIGESISLRDVSAAVANQVEELALISPEEKYIIAAACRQTDDSTKLPAVWVHGDFAPWNLKMTTKGKIVAIDWEYSFPKGLPLFDLVYFRSVQMSLFSERVLFWRKDHALALSYLESFGIGPDMLEPIVLACLLQDWVRSFVRGDYERADFLLLQIRARVGELY